LTIVDVFSGYVICSALKNETSQEIANVLENDFIKPFGPPQSVSSDNARNLSGPELQKLYNFYGIKHFTTTPYSSESHGLVENQNRYVTQLLRLYSEQFKTTWFHVLPLAVITVNNVPRDSLKDQSPAFLMFGREFFERDPNIENLLDIENYTSTLKSNQIFLRLLREYLLVQRAKKNLKKNYRTLSVPKDALIYVKDFSKVPCKKAKAIYLKAPEKVIAEYAQTVYSMDFLGKVHGRAKHNIKKASNRSLRLFEKLPLKVKMILGAPLDPKIWDEIKDTKNLPEYMEEVDRHDDEHMPIRTRQYRPNDTHILEKSADEVKEYKMPDILDLTGETLNRLKYLHEKNALIDPNMSLRDVDLLYNRYMKNPSLIPDSTPDPEPEPLYSSPLGEGVIVDIEKEQQKERRKRQRILDDMLKENILGTRTRSGKHVRLNPEVQTREFDPEKF
jgi:transposase InsO family protein